MSEDAEPASTSPIDRLLNVGLFAPLGFLLGPDKVVSDLAAAGRKQVEFSRSLGRAALKGLTRGAKPSSKPSPASPTATKSPTLVTVPGHSTKTARELVNEIPSLSAAQLRWLRKQETAGKNRVTVLRAIDTVLK